MPDGLDLLLRNIRFAFRNLALQAQLAWIRNVLRDTDADVREGAVRISGERSRAADAHMLQIELWVGERRDLRRHLLCRQPALPRRFDLRIVLFCFREQLGKRSGRSRLRRCWLLGKSKST